MKQIYVHKSFLNSLKNNIHNVSAGLLLLTGSLSGQSSYTFTPAGATGSLGPTQAQLNTAYAATNLNGQVVSATGIQTWTVPTGGLYRIDVAGAAGGSSTVTPQLNPGGTGSRMAGDFALVAGDVIRIAIGQKGESRVSGSGGGGTYVTRNNTLLIAAGGGGGATSDQLGANSVTVTSGTNDNPGGPTAGGTNGNGGQACNSSVNNAGGGGGYLTNGATGTGALSGFSNGGGGTAFVNGATGGMDYIVAGHTPGGFGGGGGATNNYVGGGGGGGYSGGAGGQQTGSCISGSLNRSGGGGGGSYNNGANQNNIPGINSGDGFAYFTSLCNLNITATNSLICTGTTVTLTTNSAGSYSWSTGPTNTVSIVVTPATTTSYSVFGQGTIPAGCTATAVITITVNTTPTVTINSSTLSACLGQSVTLTANGANTYTFNNGVTSGVAFAPPGGTTTYTVTGTNACGTATAGVTLTVSALPVTAATTSSLICAGKPATLTTSGATTYTWLPGTSTQTSYIVNPTVSTIYTVTGKTGACSGVATITVNTNPLPTLTITATPSTAICFGNSATLSVSGTATSYTWSVNAQTLPSIVVTPASNTPYSITGSNAFSCTNTAIQLITVNPNPVISVSASNPEVCSGGASTLTAGGANTYTWDTGSNSYSTAVNPAVTTIYNVTGTTTATGCFTSTMITVNVFDPEITVTSNTAICKGANTIIGASGALTYTWTNNGAMTQNILVTPTVSTTYTVEGTVLNPPTGVACPASAEIEVTVNALPLVTAVSNPTSICRGTTATLTAEHATTYTWTAGLGSNVTVTVSPNLNQTYSVSGTDANGCKGTGTVQVAVTTCTFTGIVSGEATSINVSVYPNPSSGDFTISSDEHITLQIMNELGQQVRVITLNETTPAVKINNLANGIYFISGKNTNGTVKQKIIVSK